MFVKIYLVLFLIFLISCVDKDDNVQIFSYEIDSCASNIELFLGNDSLYSFVLTQFNADIVASHIISTGTYTKNSIEYRLKESLTGEEIILRNTRSSIIPQSGRFKDFKFIKIDQLYIKDSETELSENLLYEYKNTCKSKMKLIQMSQVKSKQHLSLLNNKYCFSHGNIILNINQDSSYKLLFDDIIFSSGNFSFSGNSIKFVNHLSKVEYIAFLLEDSTLYTGNLPFSTEYPKLQLLSLEP